MTMLPMITTNSHSTNPQNLQIGVYENANLTWLVVWTCGRKAPYTYKSRHPAILQP